MLVTLLAVARLVLVHGSVSNGDAAWSAQRELADRYELVVLNRPGYPPNPPAERIDFAEQSAWLSKHLRAGDHLCGHSYGAVISLYAAAEGLRSLTVIEPPAFGVAEGNASVDDLVERMKGHWEAGPASPREFLIGFHQHAAGRDVDVPDPLPPHLEQGARALMVERGPWEADPPLEELASMPFPKLVVSGGWSPAFDAVCDVLEARLEAQRKVFAGAGHRVQAAPGFNAGLREFLAAS